MTWRIMEIEREIAARALLAKREVQPWPEGSPLHELARAEAALNLMLQGLLLHYAPAIAQGRTREWAEAGHSIINLMATQHRVASTH